MKPGAWRPRALLLLATLGFLALALAGLEARVRAGWRRGTLADNLTVSEPGCAYSFLSSDRAPWATRTSRPPFPCPKDSDTVRIVVLGESAAQGFPYPPDFSFARFLGVILQRRWPRARVQVVNGAYFAQVQSFARAFAADSRPLAPDAVILYCGNNELYPWNLYALEKNTRGLSSARVSLSRWLRAHWITFALAMNRLPIKPGGPGALPPLPAGFPSGPVIEDGFRNFARATEEIVSRARGDGARVIVLSPVRNLRDFPPLPGDDALPPLSVAEAKELAARASPSATEAFRLARRLDAEGSSASARRYYELASDMTNRVGRIHSRNIAFLRGLPERFPGTEFIDAETLARARSGRPITGNEVCTDWCHLTLEMNDTVAAAISGALERDLTARFGPPAAPAPDFRRVLEEAAGASLENGMAVGEEEAGFADFQLSNYRRAAEFFTKRLSRGYSLKSALGLYLSERRSGRSEASLRPLLAQIRERSSAEELASHWATYYPGASADEKAGLAIPPAR